MKFGRTLPLAVVVVVAILVGGSYALLGERLAHGQQHGRSDLVAGESTSGRRRVDSSGESNLPEDGGKPASRRLRLPVAPEIEFQQRWPVCSVAFAPNSRYLASADETRGVRLWDLKLHKETWHVMLSPLGAVSEERAAVAFTRDGKNLLFVSGIRDPVVLDVTSGKVLRTLTEDAWGAAALSTWRTEGTYTVVTASGGDLHFWDPATGVRLKSLKGVGGDVVSLHVASDGDRIALGLESGVAVVRELPSGRILFEVEQSQFRLHQVALSPLGDFLVSTSDEGLAGWEIHKKKRVWSTNEQCFNLAISPDGKTLVYGLRARVVLCDLRTGGAVSVAPYGSAWINSVAFNADGSSIATGAENGRVAIWPLSQVR